ncbi:UNVERIFIED_CONTAM: hypothetical protein K7Z70_16920 [Mycobacterium avium subsp. hominissuis]
MAASVSTVRFARAQSRSFAHAIGKAYKAMGRKSRHKLERRLGQVQPTRKEVERTRVKAERRAQNVPPTVEAYERAAASGPARLTKTLISRHSIRIDNLDAVAQLSMNHCLPHLLSVCELDAVFIRQGHELTQHAVPHESPWPTHLSWSLQSTIAALRLMLAGQTVGAAIVLRQQLGRWTLLLALVAGIAPRRHETIESFIARAWTHGAMEALGIYTADITVSERFDDLDDHPRTTGVIDTDHEHVPIDSRAICPAILYHRLCKLIDANEADQGVEREAVHDLDAEYSATGADCPTDALSDALTLCIIQMRFAAIAVCHASGDADTARAIGTVSTPERLAHYTSETQLLPRTPLVPRLTPALAPLVGKELAAFESIDYLWNLYTDYHAALGHRSRAQDCTIQELAELAFAAHRFSRFLVAEAARAQDLKPPESRLKVHHLTPGSPQIVTAEFAALCASWNQSRTQIAAAATLVSSTLLAGYWLWLEEDDRAMGILRCTLHQAARLRTWHNHTDTARALHNMQLTTPRRWMYAAGWSKFRPLDRALFEFAHANRESRLDASGILLGDRHNDPESALSQRLARQTALDKVTALAACETIKVVAAHQSLVIANTMREALHECGLNIQTNRTRRQSNGYTSQHRTEQDITAAPDAPHIGQLGL